jgi:hypothetical protein
MKGQVMFQGENENEIAGSHESARGQEIPPEALRIVPHPAFQ